MFIDKAIEGNTNTEHVRDNSFGNRNLFNYKNKEEEKIIQYVLIAICTVTSTFPAYNLQQYIVQRFQNNTTTFI